MTGKRNASRKDSPREVTLTINGQTVELNGYVMDVFEEVTVGLVRALGDEASDGTIEVRIGPAVN